MGPSRLMPGVLRLSGEDNPVARPKYDLKVPDAMSESGTWNESVVAAEYLAFVYSNDLGTKHDAILSADSPICQ